MGGRTGKCCKQASERVQEREAEREERGKEREAMQYSNDSSFYPLIYIYINVAHCKERISLVCVIFTQDAVSGYS